MMMTAVTKNHRVARCAAVAILSSLVAAVVFSHSDDSTSWHAVDEEKLEHAKRKAKENVGTFTAKPDSSIMDYLNPDLFHDPELIEDVGDKLRAGGLVMIEDAFVPEFANAMHEELSKLTSWKLNEEYNDDGFSFHHHNVYDDEDDFTDLMKFTADMFNHPKTRDFMEELTGRDCAGQGIWGASYYKPGDYSMPHADWHDQRSVAVVWHLTKNWKPEWGGALYWESEPGNDAYNHASFNSLSIFSVTSNSSHFVTHVSPHAKEKRFAFNGWMTSGWEPHKDDPLEEWLATPEGRLTLTNEQVDILLDMNTEDFDPNRQEGMKELQTKVSEELFPNEVTVMIV